MSSEKKLSALDPNGGDNFSQGQISLFVYLSNSQEKAPSGTFRSPLFVEGYNAMNTRRGTPFSSPLPPFYVEYNIVFTGSVASVTPWFHEGPFNGTCQKYPLFDRWLSYLTACYFVLG